MELNVQGVNAYRTRGKDGPVEPSRRVRFSLCLPPLEFKDSTILLVVKAESDGSSSFSLSTTRDLDQEFWLLWSSVVEAPRRIFPVHCHVLFIRNLKCEGKIMSLCPEQKTNPFMTSQQDWIKPCWLARREKIQNTSCSKNLVLPKNTSRPFFPTHPLHFHQTLDYKR